MNTDRKIAIVTGALFIIATTASIAGSNVTKSVLDASNELVGIPANGNPIMVGALLSFVAAATSAGIAIALYAVLRKYYEGLALGAVGFRLIEAVFYIVALMSPVVLFTLSQGVNTEGQTTFQTVRHALFTLHDLAGFVFGVFAFCIGALCYYFVFFQTKLIPRWLSVWGIAAIVTLFIAALTTLFDGEPYSISGNLLFLAAPIALQEMVLAVWLIVKGFNPVVIATGSSQSDVTVLNLAPQN